MVGCVQTRSPRILTLLSHVLQLSLLGKLSLSPPLIGFLLPVVLLPRFHLLEGFVNFGPLVHGYLMSGHSQEHLLCLVLFQFGPVHFRASVCGTVAGK